MHLGGVQIFGFMMDEVIVYQDCQDSVEYVIKVSACGNLNDQRRTA